MEQWVSDTFYSYFPSLNKNQNEKKSMLSRARQADYQEYLKNVNQIANAVIYLCFSMSPNSKFTLQMNSSLTFA